MQNLNGAAIEMADDVTMIDAENAVVGKTTSTLSSGSALLEKVLHEARAKPVDGSNTSKNGQQRGYLLGQSQARAIMVQDGAVRGRHMTI